jgi:hypothetical protein
MAAQMVAWMAAWTAERKVSSKVGLTVVHSEKLVHTWVAQ